MIRVIKVEKISPPITEIPMGLQISDPSPVLNASGSIPRMVVKEVLHSVFYQNRNSSLGISSMQSLKQGGRKYYVTD